MADGDAWKYSQTTGMLPELSQFTCDCQAYQTKSAAQNPI